MGVPKVIGFVERYSNLLRERVKILTYKMPEIHHLNYDNKIILAPMVRIGTLPMRLLALEYGADIVYCEELIDWKLLRCIRKENEVLGTVDYIDQSDGTVVFRTCPREREKVVLQIGTCSPERALQVVKLVENDVAGIDINMGCPKEFSIKGGMGVALLENPEKAKEILTTLVQGTKLPVSCKIRILPKLEDTLKLCESLAETGISAIAIHGRTRNERPTHANHNDVIKEVTKVLKIPVIANGGSKKIEHFEDIETFKKETGCSSVMLARAAGYNCSVFRSAGILPLDDVIKTFLRYAVDYDNPSGNTKYTVQYMLRELQETPLGKRLLESQTLEQICAIWNMNAYYTEKQLFFKLNGFRGRFDVLPTAEERYLRKRKAESDVTELKCAFLRHLYSTDADLPKTRLLMWTRKKGVKVPVYQTVQEDKLFKCVVTVDGKKYSSTFWEKNKKRAEQGAALVCLNALDIVSTETLINDGCIK